MTTHSPAIFLDANVPMYAGGRLHPLKQPSVEVLAFAAVAPSVFVTDAEVLQEMLRRYRAIPRWDEGRLLFEHFVLLMGTRVVPIWAEDVVAAAGLVDDYPRLAARDFLHVAVMRRVGVTHIVSADQGFDAVDGVTRLDPGDVATWRKMVERDSSAG